MNVISIDERGTQGAPGGRQSRHLLQTARDMALDRLKLALKTMLDKADDALFEFARRSENVAHQLYFDAMREVRMKRGRIEDEFKARFTAAFAERCRERVEKAGPTEATAATLSLVDNESVEEDVAVANMVEKSSNGCRDELFALTRRAGALLGVADLDQNDNPLGPRPICEAIRQACTTIEAGLKIRLIILKLFDRYVVTELGAIYHAINQFLITQQVLPEIRSGVKKSAASARRPSRQGHGTQAVNAGVEDALIAAIRQLVNPPASPGVPGGAAFAIPAVEAGAVGALTQLQQAGDLGLTVLGVDVSAAGGTNILRSIKTSGLVPALDKTSDMTIDIVAMLFDCILDDKNLPDAVRAQIGRLQIPILKVALIDREFFSRKSHPARRLLNSIAEAATGASADPSLQEGIHAAIERTVQRVLNELEEDVGVFPGLLAEFEQAAAAARHEAKVRAERTSRVVQGRSRLEEAKGFAREQVERRLKDTGAPEAVRNFLLAHWKRLLLTAYVQKGEDGAAVREAIEVMDDLLWSVTAKHGAEERKRLERLLPDLLRRVKAGMETASVPNMARTSFLTRLSKYHAAAVRPQGGEAPSDAPVAIAGPQPAAAALSPVAQAAASAATPPPDAGQHGAPDPLADTIPNPGPALAECAAPAQAGDGPVEKLPPLDVDLSCASEPPFEPDRRISMIARAPQHISTPPAGDGNGLAEALRAKLLTSDEVRRGEWIGAAPNTQVAAQPQASLAIDGADAFYRMFAAVGAEDGDLARLATIGVAVEELTLGEANAGASDGADDEPARRVKALEPGAWLDLRDTDGSRLRARLTWVNTATEIYMFTDRNGHKVAERTRNGLIAEFRRGGAQVLKDMPLLDRAFTRLLDGLGARTES